MPDYRKPAPPGYRELHVGEIVQQTDRCFQFYGAFVRIVKSCESIGKPYDPKKHYCGRYRRLPINMPHEEGE